MEFVIEGGGLFSAIVAAEVGCLMQKAIYIKFQNRIFIAIGHCNQITTCTLRGSVENTPHERLNSSYSMPFPRNEGIVKPAK